MATRYKASDWSMAVGISLIGIALMVLGAFSYWDNDKISQAGVTTTATVVDVKVSRSRTHGRTYRRPRRTVPTYTPVVRYVDATGTPQIGTSAVRSIEYKSLYIIRVVFDLLRVQLSSPKQRATQLPN